MAHPESSIEGDHPAKIVRLSDKDIRDAARILRLMAQAKLESAELPKLFDPQPVANSAEADSSKLQSKARFILSSRQMRSRYFNPAIFGEPAWDILLVLYVTDTAGGRQTIGQLTSWIGSPPTTVLRWLSYLEKEHFIKRERHPTDLRTTFLRLLDRGKDALEAYLRALPG